ncbi:MAG: hypothetical protein K0U20_08730 [Proteobacteria bacterium]|nr:hypothetical protein [Pseudomonadota bacterium]
MKYTVWYKTELGPGMWKVHGEDLDDETAGYQAMQLLKDGKAVEVRIGIQ